MVLHLDYSTVPSFPSERKVVRYALDIYEKMRVSVGALEPEQYALLGGRLDDPFYVTDFMPMPPMMRQDGTHRSSSTAVTLNGPFIEYYLNTCLIPFGKYILGVMHSHPGNMTHLSDGVPGSGQGDIPSMRGHLEAAARYGEPWHNFIAPIVTNPGPSPRVDTWIVRLDKPAVRAETIWETEASAQIAVPERPLSKLDELLDLVRYRPDLVRLILQKGDRLRPLLRSRGADDTREAERLLRYILQPRKPLAVPTRGSGS